MKRTDTVVIGGGQAGLAASRCLSDRGVDHVVLERGRVAERWRSERWNSLTLLTPNWQSRLPGFRYDGPDPGGYMGMAELIDFFERYASSFPAPLQTSTSVLAVESSGSDYTVVTDNGAWRAPSVVIATGHSDVPHIPAMGSHLSPDIVQMTPTRYRAAADLPDGGVLVVGASASGIQLADEIHQSGRPVVLAVGRHTRLPRIYRGKDILWWLDRMGIFDDTPDRVYDIEVSRRQTSLQLVGRPDHATLDLPVLERRGVTLTGRVLGVDGSRVVFDDDLIAHTTAADARLAQLLVRIDRFIAEQALDAGNGGSDRFVPFRWPAPSPEAIDLRAAGIRSVVWATGFRRDYRWLKVPVLDRHGEVLHEGGVTPAPGLYIIGLHFLRRRKSSFIDGVGDDARELTEHIRGFLARRFAQRTVGLERYHAPPEARIEREV
jgi:putative flavoprotein involved in K+ transport